jgi:hypothetical protein
MEGTGGKAVALMIVDGRGGAKVRYQKSRQYRHSRVRYQKSRQDRLWRSPMSQRVKRVHVYTCGRRRVRKSSLCPCTRFYDDLLQLKRVTLKCCSGRVIEG